MTEYVSLRSLLVNVPKKLFEESEESDFLFWFREALRMLPDITATETKVEIFEITDTKVLLPKYIKKINKVTWMYKNPSEECVQSLKDCQIPEPEIQEPDCKFPIYYKMFLDSPYYTNNFAMLKYVGQDKSLLCNNCPNFTCDSENHFVITRERMLYTNFTEGFICIEYDTEICDELGNLMIPDIQTVHNFLQSYAIKRHLEDRMFGKEESIMQMYQMYSQKSDIEYRKARAEIMFRQLNPVAIKALNGTWFNKLIKLPTIYIYERQDYFY